MWILFGLLSSFGLGFYDIFKKKALNENAVLPVLFYSTTPSLVIFSALIIFSNVFGMFKGNDFFYVPPVDISGHFFIFIKALIVGTSWILAFFAMKHLPISIISPIRASAPLWTLAGAILIYSERLTFLQWAGLIITIIFYYLFSVLGNKEGIKFTKNKWIFFIVLATMVGSVSTLYDKFLIKHYTRLCIQAYFSVYIFLFLLKH